MPALALALLTSARARAGPAAFKPEQLPGCGADQIREANQAASALHSCADRTAHAAELATAENAMEARDWTLATMQLLLMARDSTAESEATMCICASKFAAGGPACGGIGELKRNMTQSMPSCGSQEELELEENADYSYEQYDTNSYGDGGDEKSVDEGSLRLVGLAVFVAGLVTAQSDDASTPSLVPTPSPSPAATYWNPTCWNPIVGLMCSSSGVPMACIFLGFFKI